MRYACYIHNRTTIDDFDVSPFQAIYGYKPSIGAIRCFGSSVYVHDVVNAATMHSERDEVSMKKARAAQGGKRLTTAQKRDLKHKFQERAVEQIFVGIDDEAPRGWLCFDPRSRVGRSRFHCRFVEDMTERVSSI